MPLCVVLCSATRGHSLASLCVSVHDVWMCGEVTAKGSQYVEQAGLYVEHASSAPCGKSVTPRLSQGSGSWTLNASHKSHHTHTQRRLHA